MTSFLLLRHSESEWNALGRQQGWADSRLTAAGREASVRWTVGRTADFDAVASSDLLRARETATMIAASLRLEPVICSAGLREQHQGQWTGLTKAEIKRRWPDRMRERPRHPVGGESAAELVRRALAALEGLARSKGEIRILVVTHAGVIREIERHISGRTSPIPHLEGRWISRVGPSAPGASGDWALGPVSAGRDEERASNVPGHVVCG